jgi:hypothetical protein
MFLIEKHRNPMKSRIHEKFPGYAGGGASVDEETTVPLSPTQKNVARTPGAVVFSRELEPVRTSSRLRSDDVGCVIETLDVVAL